MMTLTAIIVVIGLTYLAAVLVVVGVAAVAASVVGSVDYRGSPANTMGCILVAAVGCGIAFIGGGVWWTFLFRVVPLMGV